MHGASVAAREQAWNGQRLAQPVATPRWRLWRYEQPAIVLGCSQRAYYEDLRARLAGASMEVLLRDSGGGAVLTGPWMVGLSLALPLGHAWLVHGLVDSYRPLGQLCADLLNAAGVPALALAPSQIPVTQAELAARGLPMLDWACFGQLSPWEVVDTRSRKIVGLAQRRRQTGVLLVAGMLIAEPPWEMLSQALGRECDTQALRQRTVGAASLLPSAWPAAAWREALQRRLAAVFTER